MSTGALPTQQPLPVQLPQQPQTPHVQQHVFPPSAQLQAQNAARQRQYLMLQQQARSGSVMPPPTPAITHQQELSPQPAALPNGLPNKPLANQRLQLTGQAVLRLLQFAEVISPGAQATDPMYWKELVDKFFTEWSIFKMGLWSDQKNVTEAYELTQPNIAGFFHTQYDQCKLSSIQLTLEQTEEKLQSDGSITIDCARSSLIHRYDNGGMVVSSGTLEVHFSRGAKGLRISWMEFKCSGHEEFIARNRITELVQKQPKSKSKGQIQPESHVNEWGVPSHLYMWLKISDTMGRVGELMFYSLTAEVSAKESMRAMVFQANRQFPDMVAEKSGGGKMKIAKREPKPKEERPKLTRQKTSRAKKSTATKVKSEDSGNEVAFVADPSPVVKTQTTTASNSPALVAGTTPMQTPSQLPLSYVQQQQQQFQQQMLLRQQQLYQQHQQQVLLQQQMPDAYQQPYPGQFAQPQQTALPPSQQPTQ